MVALIVGLLWFAVIGFLATASRMMWSFARDRGIPFHRIISKVCIEVPVASIYQTTTYSPRQVEPRTHIPMIAIGLVTTIPALLALIYIGSSTVFEDVVSLSTSGLYASYFIPCSLLLWRRITGQIKPHSSRDDDTTSPAHLPTGSTVEITGDDEVVQPVLAWGPWRIPGILGIANNAYACVYILFVLFWSFWPPSTPPSPSTMNYSVLMTGAVILFSIVYYHVWGKHQYMGPLIEREVRGFARKVGKDSE